MAGSLFYLEIFLFFSMLLLSADIVGAAEKSVIEKSEASLGRKMGNYRLVDQDGNQFPFHSLKGRPVLLSFMYIDCPDMCLLISQTIEDYLEKIDENLKDKLMVISVSINPKDDTPAKLREYGLAFTESFENWRFTTTEDGTLAMMVKDLGFTYEKRGDKLEHLNRITLISPDGTVAKHFYGTKLDPKEVNASINSVMQGGGVSRFFTDTFNKLTLYCSNYDQITKTYKIDYQFIVASLAQVLLGLITLLFLFWGNIKNLFRRLFSKNRFRQAHGHN